MIDKDGNYFPRYDCYSDWENRHLGIKSDSIFTDLYREFNVIPVPLQTMAAFHCDVDEIARQSPTAKAFYTSLRERQLRRIAQLRKIFFELKVELPPLGDDTSLTHDCKNALIWAFEEMSVDAFLHFLFHLIPDVPKTFTLATEEEPNDDPYYVPPPPELDIEGCRAHVEEVMKNINESNFVDSPPGIRNQYCDDESAGPDASQPVKLIDCITTNTNSNSPDQNPHSFISPPHPSVAADTSLQSPHQPSPSPSSRSARNAETLCQPTLSPELTPQDHDEYAERMGDELSSAGVANHVERDDNKLSAGMADHVERADNNENVTLSFDSVPRAASMPPMDKAPAGSAASSVGDAVASAGTASCEVASTIDTSLCHDNAACVAGASNQTESVLAELEEYFNAPMDTSEPDSEVSYEEIEYLGDADMDDTSLILDDATLGTINSALHRKKKTHAKTKSAEKRRHASSSASAPHAANKVSKKHQRPNSTKTRAT